MEYTKNHSNSSKKQTDLISKHQLDLFDSLPNKPYCMDEKPGYMLIRTKAIAVKKPYIQVNPPLTTIYFVFDDDKEDSALSWFDAGLPEPFWTTQNPTNGHCHHCYKLEVPLCTSEFGSIKAIKYAQAVYYAYALKLGADIGYSQLITKNPLHPQWRTIYWTGQAYQLDYLADFVDLPKKLPKKLEVVGLGRNVTMFEKGRHWAYKAIRDYMHHNSSYDWERAVYAQIDAINNGFEQPLPLSEVKATAKSIAKWVWQRFSYGKFSEIQAKRGAKGGKKGGIVRSAQYEPKREQAIQMKSEGMTIKAISEKLGVHRNSVSAWVKEMHK
ncbi:MULTISPECIES: replication initiation protein [Acinetobacter]|uniref:replication initiation protein n=1 Tax=Acinetobacter TaxID=469 RepID=UPI00144018CA|nr:MULTISPECIES: replication initiation protein [Acinetobacter]MDM1292565.1 replication initiation protein [Acinetobacter indicus]MDM1322578.1 replication initiation protein [Acinetobacter indicus]MDM1325338.1 replication initiation protein [Acinetobacter pseudolwoffii]MDM1334323.1 replication initiation protein [Acinetobacter indicus]QIZ57660.1 plasmid replicase [Acinetobacter indicus]